MKNDEKNPVGRPKLASDKLKKKAIITIVICLVFVLILLLSGTILFSKNVNSKQIKGSVKVCYSQRFLTKTNGKYKCWNGGKLVRKKQGNKYVYTCTTECKYSVTTKKGDAHKKVVGTGKLTSPVKGIKTCTGSDFPNYRNGRYHGGVDFNSSLNNGKNVAGKIVVAADTGVVSIKKELKNSYGNYVEINHGNGYYTLYAHMKAGSIVVHKGDVVRKGQKIGLVGSTGNSVGPHLHFELRTKSGSNLNTLNPCYYVGKNRSYK